MAEPFQQSPVCLKIETMIQNDSEREQFTASVNGTMYEKDHTTVIAYEEELEVGKVNNIVKINREQVTIVRRGALSMRQQFVTGSQTDGIYQTPYGSLAITTMTQDVRFQWNKTAETGILVLAYDLSFQGNPPSFYKVKIHLEGARQ